MQKVSSNISFACKSQEELPFASSSTAPHPRLVMILTILSTISLLASLSHPSSAAVDAKFDRELMQDVSNYLRMHRLMFVCKFNSSFAREKIRQLSRSGRAVKIAANIQNVQTRELLRSNMVVCSDNYPVEETQYLLEKHPSAGVNFSWVIQGSQESVSHPWRVKVNQRVYFLEPSSRELSESYLVNDQRVKRKLCQFGTHGVEELASVPGFLRRRSDLMGQRLRVITDFQRPYMMHDQPINLNGDVQFTKSGDKIVRIEEENTSGLIRQLLYHIMRKEMNFTTETFMRTDRNWGAKDTDGNWDGMV